MRLVLGQGTRLLVTGIAVGRAVALALGRLIANLLYGIGARDPLPFAAAAHLLIVVALAACLVPARRASRIDPAAALRLE